MSRFLRLFRTFFVAIVCAFSAFSADAYTITLVDTNAKFPSSTYTYGGYVSMTSFESGSLQNFIAPYRPGYGYAGHWTGPNCTGTRKIDPTDGTGGGAYVSGTFTQPQTLYVCWKSVLLSTGMDYSTGVVWTPRAVLLLDLNGGHGTLADEGKYWRNGGGMTFWRYDFNGWNPTLNGDCYMSNIDGVPAFFSNAGDWLLLATANNETKWMRVHNLGWGSGLFTCFFDLGVFGSEGYLPVRENYVFDGYNANTSGTGFQVMAADQEYSPWKLKGASAVMSGMPSSFGQGTFNTIYAKWTPAVYRVNLSGVGVSPSYVYLRYGEGWYDTQEHAQAGGNTGKITSLTTQPVNGNFIFKGYYVGQNGTGTQIVNENKTFRTDTEALTAITQNYTTIYPYWENPPAVWYTLTLNDDGAGTLSNPRVLYYSSSCTTSGYRLGADCSYSVVNRINIPRKTGHYYGGHYYNGYMYVNSNGTFNSQTMNLTENVTATASWVAQSFDVAYASGWDQPLGGSAPTNPLQCVYGNSCIAPGPGWTAPLRYNFAGWSCVVNGSGYMRDGGQGVNSGGNTATAPCAQSVYHIGDSLSDATNVDTITGITGITLTAIWVPDNAVYHQFTLNANGGGGRSGSNQGVFYSVENVGWFYNTGSAYQINTNPPNIFTPIAQGGGGLSAPTPPSSNLFFAGYWTEQNGGTQVVDYAGNILVPTTQYTTDKTLYAHYVAPVSVQLNTNCSYDDGCYMTNGWSCSACEITSINVVPGRPLPSIRCAPTKEESFFVGYSSSREPGEGEMYYFSDGVNVFTNPSVTTWPTENGPTELYAIWSRVQYGVNYWCDAGATQFGDKSAATFKCPLYTVLIGGTSQLCPGTSASSSQIGQKFSHWYLQGDTGHTFTPAEQIGWEYQEDKNLVAAYNPIYRLVLRPNGADNVPLPVEAYFSDGNWYSDASATVPLVAMNPAPTKLGYSLRGYMLDGTALFLVNGNGVFQTASLITNAINANNLTMTAQWREKAYVAALDSQLNGAPGTNNGTEKIYYKITVGWVANALSNVEIPSITRPTQPGKVFNGYYTDQGLQVIDGTGSIVVTGDDALQLFSSSDDIVLVASWDDVPTAPSDAFTITTTNLAANTTFGFGTDAAVDLWVQWDATDSSTIEHIVRPTAGGTWGSGITNFSHTYSTGGVKTIKFWGGYANGRAASSYSIITQGGYAGFPSSVIEFGDLDSQLLIAGVSGSLGKLFPTIDGGGYAKDPSFQGVFQGAVNLTSVPGNLFSGATNAVGAMFDQTFSRSGLTSIPGNLFSGVSGSAEYMFYSTFSHTPITGIPSNLFSNVTSASEEIFNSTFYNCTNLESIPSGLFSNISNVGRQAFFGTFSSCTSLETIPTGLFSSVTDAAFGLFGMTFADCTSLETIPNGFFNSISGTATAMFEGTFKGCTSLTSLPTTLFTGISNLNNGNQVVISADAMFAEMFYGDTALSGYIPKTLFANMVDGTNGTLMSGILYGGIFANTNLATSCTPYNLSEYTTGFESYWENPHKVVCAPAATFSCRTPNGIGTPAGVQTIIWADEITNSTTLPAGSECVASDYYHVTNPRKWWCTGNDNCDQTPNMWTAGSTKPSWLTSSITENVSFYMGYPGNEYTVALDPNGATFDANDVQSLIEIYNTCWKTSANAECSNALVLDNAQLPSYSGYNFIGYFDTSAPSGGNMMINVNGQVIASTTALTNSNQTWYARWSAVTGPFTATFRCTPTGDAVHTITDMYVGQSSANITMPAWNTYCGNVGSADTFKGWKIVQNGAIVQPGSYTWTLYSDSDVVAQWETTITLNAHTDFNNDGSNDPWNTGGGTESIYTRYGDGVYRKKENGVLSEKMLTGENPIVAPGKAVLVLFNPANVNAVLTVNGSTYKNLGTYQSAAALRAAHPTAQSGNYAIVQPSGGTAKYWVWSSSGTTHEWYEWNWPVDPLYSVHVGLPFQGFYSTASGGSGPYIRSTDPYYITSSGMQTGTAYTSNQTWHAHWDSVNLSNSHFLSQNNVSFDDLAPTRPGYIFDGWYDAQSGGHKIVNVNGQLYKQNGENLDPVVMTQNITLYAHWTQCGATAGTGAHASVTGTTSSSDQCIYAITCDVCPDSSNAQECYSQQGGFDTTYSFNIATSQTSGVLTGAVCSARSYEINYENLQGATPSETGMPSQYTYGIGETVNGTPVSDTQIFDSWCWDSAGTDHCQASQSISTSAHGDKVYYAKWRDECLPGYTRYNFESLQQFMYTAGGGYTGAFDNNVHAAPAGTCVPIRYHVNCDKNCDGDVCSACLEDFNFSCSTDPSCYENCSQNCSTQSCLDTCAQNCSNSAQDGWHFGGGYNIMDFVVPSTEFFTMFDGGYAPVRANGVNWTTLPENFIAKLWAVESGYAWCPQQIQLLRLYSDELGWSSDFHTGNYKHFINSVANEAYNSSNPTPFNRLHYTFDGLWTAENGGIQYIDGNGNFANGNLTGYNYLPWPNNGVIHQNMVTPSRQFQNFFFDNNIAPSSTSPYTFNVYAHWIPDVYEITLDRQGGSNGLTKIYEKYSVGWSITQDGEFVSASDLVMGSSQKPTLTGYNFAGYYTSASCGGTKIINADGTMVTGASNGSGGTVANAKYFGSDSTLYACWSPKDFAITLDNAHATTNGTAQIYSRVNDGVYRKKQNGVLSEQMTPDPNGQNPITKPQRKYTVSFSLNYTGAPSAHPANQTSTYVFDGYYVNENQYIVGSTGKITQPGIDAAKLYLTPHTWNARWSTNSGSVVTLPGVYGSGSTYWGRDGYIFTGWYRGNELVGVKDDTYTPTATEELKAHWEECNYAAGANSTIEYDTTTDNNECVYTVTCDDNYWGPGNVATFTAYGTANVATGVLTGCNTSGEHHIFYHPHGGTNVLPEGYTPLEYITFNGTQYIDTGVKISKNYDILTKFEPTVSSKFLYAARNSGDTASVSAYIGANWRWGNQAKSVAAGLNTVHTTIHNINGISDNGTLNGYTATSGDFETAFTLAIGANHNSDSGYSSSDRFSGNVYWLVILDENGNSVRHFVPVKNSSNVAGLYDLVTKEFFPKAAGDAFGAGDEVETPYPSTYMYNEGATVYGWPKRDHSVFEGWCRNYNESSHEYGDCWFPHGIDATETADVNLYAKWSCEPGYSLSGYGNSQTCVANTIQITYANGDHGTAPTQPNSCTYGQTFDLPSAIIATDGYVFNKWSVNGNTFNASQEIMCNEANLGVTSGSVTITATWNAQIYDITYNYNGGTKTLLPSGYTQLEYIQASGGSYINTGIKATNNTRAEGIFYVSSGFDGQVFGSYDSNKYFRMYVPSGSLTGSVFDSASFTPSSILPTAFARETKIRIKLDNTGIYIGDNTYTYNSTPSAFTATSNMYLGAINAYTSNTKYFNGRIYGFGIWQGDVLVRNFVPAKNSSNVAGMYDTVSGQFFTSATSTQFSAGTTATLAGAYPAQYTHGVGAVVYGVPTRAHSVFQGWCRNQQLTSGCAMPHEIDASEHANVPLWAKWSCDPGYELTNNNQQCTARTYDMNYTCSDGEYGYTYEGTAPTKQTAQYLAPAPINATLPGIGNCKKKWGQGTSEYCEDCFNFLGWRVLAEKQALSQTPAPHVAGGMILTWGETDNTTWCDVGGANSVNSDWGSTSGLCAGFLDDNPFTLVPFYEPKTYDIEYMYATGTGQSGRRPESYQYTYGADIDGSDLTLEHGTFLGWCKDDPTLTNCTSGEHYYETSVGPRDHGDHIYYAKWACNENEGYALSYDENNNPVCTAQIYDIDYNYVGGTQSLLPSGYTQLEYIQASGSSYMDLGFKANSRMRIETEFKRTNSANSSVFGVYGYGGNITFYTAAPTANSYFYGASKIDLGVKLNSTDWHNVVVDGAGGSITVDGVSTAYSPSNFTQTQNMILFGRRHNTSGYGMYMTGQIKYFTVYNNGELYFNGIPAQHGNDVGMYDTVSGQFFKSETSTQFSAGTPATLAGAYPEHYTHGVGAMVYGVPTRAHSIFQGWCRTYNESGNTYSNCAMPHEITTTDIDDIPLYAKWSCEPGYHINGSGNNQVCAGNSIQINYANGGHGGTPPQATTCTYGQTPDPQLQDAMGEVGWSFVGWNLAGSTYAANASVPCDFEHLGVYSGSVTATAVWSAQEYTVTYDCGDPSWGTPPPAQNAATGQPFPVAMHANCDRPGYSFHNWLVSGTGDEYSEGDTIESWNYTGNKTFTAQWDFNPVFKVKTVSTMPANTAISFKIAAKGTFVVNCGTDGTLTSSASDVLTDGMTISRSGTATQRTYTCTYSTGGSKTIEFGGRATEYNSTGETSTLQFFMGNLNNDGDVKPIKDSAGNVIGYEEGSEVYIAGIWGSLGAIFPTIGTGGSFATQPRFYRTFMNAHEMSQKADGTGSSLTLQALMDMGLFNGISGIPVSYMFYSTFHGCEKLTGTIPGGFFGMISGAPKTSLFRATFRGCKGLTGGIPGTLFSTISGAPQNQMFMYTFSNCTGLTGSIGSGLFSGISGTAAASMYYGTFYGDTNLTGSIPSALFGNISGTPKSSMFYATFYNCQNLTGSIPSNLFKGTTGTGAAGAPQSSMFSNTFYNCKKLTGSIPSALFGNISGAPATYMFNSTFANCQLLSGPIPENLFGNISGAPATYMFASTFYGCSNLTGTIPTNLFKGNGTGISGAPANNMFSGTFYNCQKLEGEIPSGLFGNINGDAAQYMFNLTFYACKKLTGTIPSNLFGTITGTPKTRMFRLTFYGANLLTGYVPAGLFGTVATTPVATEMMDRIFAGTNLVETCPCGTTEVASDWKVPYWQSSTTQNPTTTTYKVSCEVDTTSGAFYWYNGQCTTKCAEEVIDELHAGSALTYTVLKDPLTAPSINIKYGNTICYVPVGAGNGGTNSLNMSYGGTTYHAVEASNTPPAGFGQR